MLICKEGWRNLRGNEKGMSEIKENKEKRGVCLTAAPSLYFLSSCFLVRPPALSSVFPFYSSATQPSLSFHYCFVFFSAAPFLPPRVPCFFNSFQFFSQLPCRFFIHFCSFLGFSLLILLLLASTHKAHGL